MSPASHKSSPFLNFISDFMFVRRYSKLTVKSYLYWIRYYIVLHDKRHPEGMGALEVEQFLTHLAVKRKVAVSTQKIALNELAFLYNRVLEKPFGTLGEFNRAKTPAKLPVVLSRHEMTKLLHNMEGISQLVPRLMQQIERVEMYLKEDSQLPQFAGVWMPDALSRKYREACRTLGWQYRFPSPRLAVDPESGKLRRHHIDESNINRATRMSKAPRFTRTYSNAVRVGCAAR